MAHEVKRVRRKRRVQSPRDRGAGFRVRRLAIYAAAVVAGFAVGFLFLTYVPRAYSSWRESRLLKHAQEMVAREEFDQATRAAQQMLQIRPDSVAAFRILADATEKQNRPETVAWRAQIARALPNDLAAHLNLASAALRFGQLDAARRALENTRPQDREKAAYHVVAGWLARAEGNDAGVESHFAAAVQQEPENDLYQFNLAVLRVRSVEQEKSSSARETLERLKKIPAFRAGSLRALLGDAVQRDDLQKADALAQDLQMSQQVTFADHLLCLDLYRKLDEKKFEALLEKVKPVAAREPRDVAALMDWMIKNGLAAEVLKWTDKLPAEISTAPPSAVSVAEAFAEVKNWSRLRRWTRSGAWGDSEYLRWAYQAYAARQSRESAADTEAGSLWSSAERAASEQPEREANLARLAAKWGLAAEAKQLWRQVAKHPPFRREALDALFRIHRTNNELQDLLQVSRQLHESSPRETSLTSNYARLALLLAPNTEEARRKAKEAYDIAPKDANAAVTYAFALYHLGRTAEGLDVLKQVPREELEDAHLAAYAAVLFLDENQPDAAREHVETAQRGPLYLEEKKLLDEALSKAQPGPQPPPSAPAAPQPSPAPAAATPGPMR